MTCFKDGKADVIQDHCDVYRGHCKWDFTLGQSLGSTPNTAWERGSS